MPSTDRRSGKKKPDRRPSRRAFTTFFFLGVKQPGGAQVGLVVASQVIYVNTLWLIPEVLNFLSPCVVSVAKDQKAHVILCQIR
jgi:hypothetical protein